MFGAFDISTSALSAQRTRLDTIASNIANIDSISGPNGEGPYRRLFTVFEPQQTAEGGAGVRVASIQEDQSDFHRQFEPWNTKYADSQGYVKYPNVDLENESVDALETTRAYEANITAIETTKSMMNSTLRLLA